MKLSVVVPVYNSEATLARVVNELFDDLAPSHELDVVLVDDGSVDRSHEIALAMRGERPGAVTVVRLTRNFGEHAAVMCGLSFAQGDFVAIVDDDLQNPASEVHKLLERAAEGYDVVYSRYVRKQHGLFRRLASALNDSTATHLLGKPRGLYLSSFKVLSRRIVDHISSQEGPFPYLDALILARTSSIASVECLHRPRSVGRSNYTIGGLVAVWMNMATYSLLPVRLAFLIGMICIALGAVLGLVAAFHPGSAPPGLPLSALVSFMTGMQLAFLGVIGEYTARAFLHHRLPQSVVQSVHGREIHDEPGP